MHGEVARGRHAPEGAGDVARRRQEERVGQAKPDDDLPGNQDKDARGRRDRQLGPPRGPPAQRDQPTEAGIGLLGRRGVFGGRRAVLDPMQRRIVGHAGTRGKREATLPLGGGGPFLLTSAASLETG